MEGLGLERLLYPKGIEEFIREDFQKRPCVIRGRDPTLYAGLVTLEQVEQLIDTYDARDGKCRLLGGADASGRRTPEKSGELQDVLVAYGRGASINLGGLDRRCLPVGELRGRLRMDFAAHGVLLTDHGDSVVFITPTNSQALKPHIDPDDLFILQLEGRKHWQVFAHDPFWRQKQPGELPPAAIDIELAPGDLLYIPQHWIHVAGAGQEFSFALTVGVRPVSWSEILRMLVTRHLSGVMPLHEALPPWAVRDGKLTPDGRARLSAMISELLDPDNFQRVLDQIEIPMVRTPSQRSAGIAAINDARSLNSETVCALARPARVEHLGDGMEIATSGRRVKGPPSIGPALVWIAGQSAAFPVGAIGGGLTESAKIVLARRLVMEGILSIAAQ